MSTFLKRFALAGSTGGFTESGTALKELGRGFQTITGARAAQQAATQQSVDEAKRIQDEAAKLEAAPQEAVNKARLLAREKLKKQKEQGTLLGGSSTAEGGKTLLG